MSGKPAHPLTSKAADEFERWFRREAAPYEGAIQARLSRLLPSPADVQDVLWSAYERLLVSGAWRGAERPAELIFRIARNLAIDQLRRSKVVAFESASDSYFEAAAETPGPEERLDDRRAVEILDLAVKALPPQCRRIFVMRRIWGLSPQAIAEQTGLSVSTIEKHVAKGLKLCADRLAQAGLERTTPTAWLGRTRTAKP